MVKLNPCAGIFAILLTLGPGAVLAGGLPFELACDLGAGDVPEIREEFSRGRDMFRADPSQNAIFYNPQLVFGFPQPVVNIEFARTCLQYFDAPRNDCGPIWFLLDRGLLFSSDVEVIERYYFYEANQEDDPARREQLFQGAKNLYSCF